MTRLTLLTLALSLLASCTHHSEPAPDSPKSSVLIDYHKTGGIAGVSDHVTISSDGQVAWQTRGGKGADLLSPQHMARLTEAFDDWDKYNADYSAPAGSRDHFNYDLAYNGKHVKFSDISPNLPPKLLEAAKAVAELVKK